MSLPSYLQDDDDDEDDDFIPGMEDEDEDFRSDDGDEFEVDKDAETIPPFLQGYLMANPTDHRTIIFKDSGSFCLRSESEAPTGWRLCNPLLSTPLSFTGWIGGPATRREFKVQILEQEIVDSLDEKLLQAQHEKLESELEGNKIVIVSPASVDQDQKEAACPAKCSKKTPIPKPASTSDGDSNLPAYSIMGSTCNETNAISFRGVFRPPTNNEDGSSVFIICTTKVENLAVSTPSPIAATATKRKRDDANGSNSDSDSDGDNGGSSRIKIDYQELIDLHEDARQLQQQRPK